MSPPALSSLSGLVAASCTARPFASGEATHAPSALGTLPSGHGAVEGASSVACAAAGVAIATAKANSEQAQSRGADGKQGVIIGRLLAMRSEEHTSELQSLMRISYAVFCLKKKTHE